MLWGMVTYAGLYRWLAELQIERSGEYYSELTAVVPGFILAAPALWYIRIQLQIRKALEETGPAVEASRTRRTAKIMAVAGVVLGLASAGAYTLSQQVPDGSEAALPLNAANLGPTPLPKSKVAMLGDVDPDASSAVSETGRYLDSNTIYIGFRPKGSLAAEPVRFFLERHVGGSDGLATAQMFAPEQTGYLIENGVPALAIQDLEKNGIVIASPHYLLRTGDDALREPHYVTAGLTGVMAFAFLLVAAIWAFKGRGKAKARTAPEPQSTELASTSGQRFGIDRADMFDLSATQRLAVLFSVHEHERGEAWTEAFFDAAWNASVSIPEPPDFDGPDGFPYYRLDLPRAGEEFDSQSLSNLAETCLNRNAGAAFFATPSDPDTSPEYVLSMGYLDSLLRYDTPDGDPIDRGEMSPESGSARREIEISKGDELLVGAPSPDFLPPYAAAALHRYMTRIWGLEEPRVQLMVNRNLRPTRNLVIGRKRSQFASDAEVDGEILRLFWFLPRYRGIVLMPEDWTPSDMSRLTDLFQTTESAPEPHRV